VMEKEIRLSVHLPAGYEGTDMRFPVVYVHGGASVRDKLELPLALDNLAGGEMQPLIAVFILEEPPFFGVEKYAELCGREIPEFVDREFRTLATRENRAQVGWGFSGQAIAQTALTHAELNGKLGLTSPFIISPDQLKPFLKPAADFPLDVYIDWGKYDTRAPLESWDVARFGSLLTEAFRANGYEPLGGEFHEGSDVPAWRNRTDDLFRALFPAK
jgi:Putative esterase